MRLFYFILLCLAFKAAPASGAAEEALVPLFVIERNLNGNVVHYDAKLKDGKLDPTQPVVVYWVMGEDGHHQELNLVEKLKAYGFSIRPEKQPEAFRMILMADKKREIHILRFGDAIRAAARIGQCDAYLQKIFIASKKSWMITQPEYAEMIGSDMSTGAECRERITPGDR